MNESPLWKGVDLANQKAVSTGIDLWQQFKGFALKGNLIDLAVAVVIGNAFGAVVNSLVKDVLMPILGTILPAQESYQSWRIGPVAIGLFLGELLNFLIIAGALFVLVVKVLGALRRTSLLTGPAEPTTRECPLCVSTIAARARKCPQCTADLPAPPVGAISPGAG